MVFQILIGQMESGCSELEKPIKEVASVSEEIKRVKKEIQSMSGLEEIGVQLRDIQVKVDEEIRLLNTMANVLNKSLSAYVCCENRIISEYEQERYLYTRRDVGLIIIQ